MHRLMRIGSFAGLAALMMLTAGPNAFAQTTTSGDTSTSTQQSTATTTTESTTGTGNASNLTGTATSTADTGNSTGSSTQQSTTSSTSGSTTANNEAGTGTASSTTTSTTATGTQQSTVTITDNTFNPADITVPEGTTVTWTNQGQNTHTVTANDSSFDSGNIQPGGSYSHAFPTAGTYQYYCRYHGTQSGIGMTGIVTVTAAATTGNTTSNTPATNNTSTSSSTLDTTAPTAPTGFWATSTVPSQVVLNWTASTDPDNTSTDLSYHVSRDGSHLATTSPGATTYTDTPPASTTASSSAFSYALTASDPAGNMSVQTYTVSITPMASSTGGSTATSTTGTSTLPTPVNLAASSTSPTTITLTWNFSTDSTTPANVVFRVFRNSAEIGSTTAASTSSGSTSSPQTVSFTDTGLNPGTTYSYFVTANDQNGNTSPQSATTTATTLPATQSGGTGTSTPGSIGSNQVFGWILVPSSFLTMYPNVFSSSTIPWGTGGGTSTSTQPGSPYTYSNGYPMMNGNYIDCSGNVDNDPAHHTTNPNDTDPAHHIGQNCSGGSPLLPGGMNMGMPGNMPMGGGMDMMGMMNHASLAPGWVAIPLTRNTLQALFNFLGTTSSMTSS